MCVFLLTFLWSLLFIVKYWTVLSLQASKKVFKWINLRYFLRSNFKSERKSLETTRIINWSTQILTLSSQVKGTIHATIKNIYVELFIHPGFFLLELEQDRSQFWCLNHQKKIQKLNGNFSFLEITTGLPPALRWQVLSGRKKIVEIVAVVDIRTPPHVMISRQRHCSYLQKQKQALQVRGTLLLFEVSL